MKAVPAKFDSAVDSPEPLTITAPPAGQVTDSEVTMVGVALAALPMLVVPAAKPLPGSDTSPLAVKRPFQMKLVVLVCGVVRYTVKRYRYAAPGVQLSTRWTLRKSRLASPLKTPSADDCTTLVLSVARLSREML